MYKLFLIFEQKKLMILIKWRSSEEKENDVCVFDKTDEEEDKFQKPDKSKKSITLNKVQNTKEEEEERRDQKTRNLF